MSLKVLLLFSSFIVLQQQCASSSVSHLFEKLETQIVPLYSCKGWNDGIKYRLPKTMSCPLVSTEEKSRLVNITFWAEQITSISYPAFECFATKTTNVKTWWFFGPYESKTYSVKLEIAKTDCEEMVMSKRSPKGEQLYTISEGYYGTQNEAEAKYGWPGSDYEAAINYYFVDLSIFVSPKDYSVQTTSRLTEKCSYSSGQCNTALGILIWENKKLSGCSLKNSPSTICLKTGNRITCPDVNVAITATEIVTVCNMRVYATQQGLLFSFDDKTIVKRDAENYNDVLTTSEVLKNLAFLNKPRGKRQVDASKNVSAEDILLDTTFSRLGYQPTSFFSSGEVNGRLQYLHDVLAQNMTYAVQQIHTDICKTNKKTFEILRIMAEGGSVSMLVSVLLGERNYKARLLGDVIGIWKCQPLRHYRLLQRKQCIKEWPVEYVVNNKTLYGFVVPLSHEIVDNFTEVQCPGTNFYFDMGADGLVMLGDTAVEYNLPFLPLPSEATSTIKMSSLSFTAPGVYSLEDISGSETILELMRDIQKRFQIESFLWASETNEPLQQSQMRIGNALYSFIMQIFNNLIFQIISGIGGLVLTVALCYLCFVHRKEIAGKCFRCYLRGKNEFPNVNGRVRWAKANQRIDSDAKVEYIEDTDDSETDQSGSDIELNTVPIGECNSQIEVRQRDLISLPRGNCNAQIELMHKEVKALKDM